MKFNTAFFANRRYPSRPSLADLEIISDPALRRVALAELNRIVDAGLARVYVPAAADFWNVWLEALFAPPHGERVTLEERCQRFVAQHGLTDGTRPGGGAARAYSSKLHNSAAASSRVSSARAPAWPAFPTSLPR